MVNELDLSQENFESALIWNLAKQCVSQELEPQAVKLGYSV